MGGVFLEEFTGAKNVLSQHRDVKKGGVNLLEIVKKSLLSGGNSLHSISLNKSCQRWYFPFLSHTVISSPVPAQIRDTVLCDAKAADQSGLKGVAFHCPGWLHKSVPPRS